MNRYQRSQVSLNHFRAFRSRRLLDPERANPRSRIKIAAHGKRFSESDGPVAAGKGLW
jgi:hypothetical protein